MKKQIPNLFTLLNLFTGCIAAKYAFEGVWDRVVIFTFIGAVFDLFDGMAARILKAHSPIGKELDSLADVVSFGLVPGVILYTLFKQDLQILYGMNFSQELKVLTYLPFIVTLFSALRLAKFNIDTRQSDSFIGVPTPANTLLIISLPMIAIHGDKRFADIIGNPWVIAGFAIVTSYLLVSEIHLLGFKFKTFGWKGNEIKYIFIALIPILGVFLHFLAIPILFVIYILLSFVSPSIPKPRQREEKK